MDRLILLIIDKKFDTPFSRDKELSNSFVELFTRDIDDLKPTTFDLLRAYGFIEKSKYYNYQVSSKAYNILQFIVENKEILCKI